MQTICPSAQEHVKRFLASDLTRQQYCQEHSLQGNIFLYWLGHHAEQMRNWSTVQIETDVPKSVCNDICTITLSSGDKLELPASTLSHLPEICSSLAKR